MKQIAILGEGAWGTAMATLLAQNGHRVTIWCYHPDLVDQINNHHENTRFLPGISLDASIQATNGIERALDNAEWVFEAIPVQFLRSTLQDAVRWFDPAQMWVVLSKGIEQCTLLFPAQILDDVCGVTVQKAILAGPSFAHDVARKQVTAVTVAATDATLGFALQRLSANHYFRPYVTTDVLGIQVGAALKNVVTIGVGMLEGAGYTENTKAFLLTRGLQEMVQVATLLGGRAETIYGLAGVGDLVLTAMGSRSKNLEVGKRLGAGQSLERILQETGHIPEGINTVQSMYQLANRYQIELPICQGLYEIIFGKSKTVRDMIRALMV